MNFVIVKNYDELSALAFKQMQRYLIPNANIGLATGNTPVGLYSLMSKADIDYSEISTFNLDEYVGIPSNHPCSFYSFMEEHLFSKVNLKKENTHVPSGMGDVEKNAVEFEQLIKENPLDIQLLGIGSDGHIGFNEPGYPLDSCTHIVTLNQQTIKDNEKPFLHIGEQIPSHAITMGLKTIMSAKSILLIASGENKAEAVKKMVTSQIDPACPATVLQDHPNVTVILDEAAAKLL